QTIDLDVADQPLVNAINQLKELTKVNIVVDNVLLAQNGIDVNTAQVSVKKQGVKARTALREVLGTYHLSYAILDRKGTRLTSTTRLRSSRRSAWTWPTSRWSTRSTS